MSKKLIITGILLLIGIILASIDPLALKPIDLSIAQNTAIQFFYFTPCVLYVVFAYTLTQYGRRSMQPEEKAEKLKSFIRSGIQIAGTLIALAASFNLDIPLINQIRQTLSYLTDNLDIAANSVLALIGFLTTIYGFFKNSDRFVDRSERVEGKELKVD